MTKRNSGVSISGHATVHGGQFGGEGATVIGNVGAPAVAGPANLDELHAAILDLAAKIRATDLPDREELAGITDSVAGQVKQDKPNKTMFKGLLETVRGGVEGITALTGLVAAIQQAAGALLGIG